MSYNGDGGEGDGSEGKAARDGMGFGGTGSGIGGDNSYGRDRGYGVGGFSSVSDADVAAGLNPNAASVDTTITPSQLRDSLIDKTKAASAQPDGMSIPGYSVNGLSTTAQKELQRAGLGDLSANGSDTAPSQSINESLAANNAEGIIGRTINFVPGVAQTRAVAGLVSAATDPNKSFAKAVGDATLGYVSNSLLGKVNQGIMSALGPDVAGAVNNANKFAGEVNALSPDTMPTINPAKSMFNQLAAASKDAPGLDGTAYGVGGFSNSGGGSAVAPAVTSVAAIPAATPIPTKEENTAVDGTFGLFGNGLGLIGQKIARSA